MKKKTQVPVFRKKETSIRYFLLKNSVSRGRGKKAQKAVYAFLYFTYCLHDQEKTIEHVMDAIQNAEIARQEAETRFNAKKRISADLNEIFDEMKIESLIASNKEMRNIFAGTLFVILNSLLWSMSIRIKMHGGSDVPQSAGRKIGRTSLFQLIRAAGNNFRHFDEWHGATSKNKNIAVLRAAGIKRPWNQNKCGEILDLIGWKDRKTLSLEILALASEILNKQTGLKL